MYVMKSNFYESFVVTFSFWKGGVFSVFVGVFIASTVSSTEISTRRVNYPQSLGEFCNCGILTGPTPLSLASKELFQRILWEILTQKGWNFRDSENKSGQFNKGANCIGYKSICDSTWEKGPYRGPPRLGDYMWIWSSVL